MPLTSQSQILRQYNPQPAPATVKVRGKAIWVNFAFFFFIFLSTLQCLLFFLTLFVTCSMLHHPTLAGTFSARNKNPSTSTACLKKRKIESKIAIYPWDCLKAGALLLPAQNWSIQKLPWIHLAFLDWASQWCSLQEMTHHTFLIKYYV